MDEWNYLNKLKNYKIKYINRIKRKIYWMKQIKKNIHSKKYINLKFEW